PALAGQGEHRVTVATTVREIATDILPVMDHLTRRSGWRSWLAASTPSGELQSRPALLIQSPCECYGADPSGFEAMSDRGYHRVDLGFSMPGGHGECEDLIDDPLGLNERRGGKAFDGGLTVARHRIMDSRLNAARVEKCGQLIPPRSAHDIEVIHVSRAGPLRGQNKRQVYQRLVVARGEPTAVIVHGVEPAKERAADGGLDLVEAQIEADLRVNVFVDSAMIAQPPAASGDLVVIRDHGAAIAHDGEVLGGIEGEDGGGGEGADFPAAPLGSLGLGAVLQEPHAQARRQLTDALELAPFSIAMH